MKKIEAVIPASRVDAVREELCRRGVCGGLALTHVLHGSTHKQVMTEANGSNRPLQEGVKLELIVSDRQVEKALIRLFALLR